jgi:uncharacterized phage-associated protein
MADVASPSHVADFLLHECRERGDALTNLKLQKLLYYADGWHIALHGQPLFDEAFQAWVHGPVLPSQYRRFRDNQWRPILSPIERPDLPGPVAAHLVEIVDVFGSETAVALELMTHRESPWIAARGGLPAEAPSTNEICKHATGDYFRSLDAGQQAAA